MEGEELVDIVVVWLYGMAQLVLYSEIKDTLLLSLLTSIDFYHLGGVRAHAFQRGDIIY